jgi:hypothetical protein
MLRRKVGRKTSPSAAIIDSQTVIALPKRWVVERPLPG